MNTKRHPSASSKKGFTLVELLIVIVIIGILLGFLLPRLVDTRERAEDLGVEVGMTQIAQALEAYYTDFGIYPGTAGVAECLTDGQTVHDALNTNYISGVPVGIDNATTTFDGESCIGTIAYAPLRDNGITNNGYVLAADVQLVRNANYDSDDIDLVTDIDANTTQDALQTLVDAKTAAQLDTAETNDPSRTIYVLISN